MPIIDALRALYRDDRGQALYEAVLFAPLLIFGIGLLFYFSQLGVLAERSETAVRYGNDVSYKNNNTAYSVASVYALLDQLQNPSVNTLGPLCLESSTAAPATPAPDPANATAVLPAGTAPPSTSSTSQARIRQDIHDALTQSQNDGGSVGPSAKPFFQPAQISVPACQGGSLEISSATSTGTYSGESPAQVANGGLPVSTAGFSVSSQITKPTFLNIVDTNYVFGGTPNLVTGAKMTFINVAAPSTALACLPGLAVAAAVLAPNVSQAQRDQLKSYCPAAPTGLDASPQTPVSNN